MSLITDIDYLIHTLRLTYLRHSEDPYAPRIVSLDPNYPNNPHIRAAGLAELDRWPEASLPISPQLAYQDLPSTTGVSDVGDPGAVLGKWPGATGLKYTQTIMGNRSGGAGMRVTGRRTSKASPFVPGPLAESRLQRLRADSEPTPVSASPPASAPFHVESASPVVLDAYSSRRRSSGGSTIVGTHDRPRLTSDPTVPVVEPEAQAPATPTFAPQFARGAEMEARRRLRMRARFPATTSGAEDRPIPAVLPVVLVDEDSDDSEPEEEEYMDEALNEAEEAREIGDDEFDGADFLTPGYGQRSMVTSNGSDDMSVLSAQMGMSMSQASGYNLSLQANSVRNRTRLSPVAETTKPETQQPSDSDHARIRRPSRQNESGGPSASESSAQLPPKPPVESPEKPLESTAPLRTTPRPKGTLATKASMPSFGKKISPPTIQRPGPSALTAKLASQSVASDNPFTELYAAISGREDSHFELTIYFPHSKTYKSSPRKVKVRQDVSVEEVIGHGLWIYWEDKAEPRLDEGLDDNVDKSIRLSAVGWCLRIVEDDGEVDEDYPVVGRTSVISRWWKYGLAVCEATASQAQQNLAMDSTIVRRPSRLMTSSRSRNEGSTTNGPSAGNLANGTTSGGLSSSDALTSSALTGVTSMANLHSSTSGAPIFLKITVAEAADAIHYSTTLNVTTDMYMADVLDLVCRKRRLPSSKDWALLLEDRSILIPLDRTVASLEGRKDLVIMKRSLLDNLGSGQGRQPGRSADPNASIFDKNKYYSDLPPGGVDFTSAYKKYTIYRKVPMVFGSHERVLAIDGDYIHFMPSATKALLESAKTSSYHIKTVINCILTKKDAASVKMIVRRDGGNKRYDFEAESPALAAEIVATIKNLQKSYMMERSGSHHRPKDKNRRPRSSSVIA